MPRLRKWRFELLEDRRLLTTFSPTVLGDTGAGSLRAAIIAANADAGSATDTIQLGSGTYNLTIANSNTTGHENASTSGDLNIISAAHMLIIQGNGSSGPNATIIQQDELDRVFEIAAGVTVEFENLEITGGRAEDTGTAGELPFANDEVFGGGILNYGSATLQNVVVIGNNAGSTTGVAGAGLASTAFGGGIYNSGTMVIDDSLIEDNSVIGGDAGSAGGAGGFAGGGGIVSSGPDGVTITDTTVQGNSAKGGQAAAGSASVGAANADGGQAEGGGSYLADFGADTLIGDTFSGNTATGGAGGNAQSATAFGGGSGGNAAGGGLDLKGPGSVALANDTIAGNSITSGNGGNGGSASQTLGLAGDAFGGGLHEDGNVGPTTLTNITVTGNAAATGAVGNLGAANSAAHAEGGGVTLAGTATIQNTVIAGNTVSFPAGSNAIASGPDVSGTATTSDHNLVGSYDASVAAGFSGANGDILGSASTPVNAALGPLQINVGGLTQTEAELAGSPAIGAGDPAAATSAGLTTDQRGTGFARIVNGKVDIGAFEVQSAATAGAAVKVDLTSYFNLLGITPDGQKFTGGLDGVGNALSAKLLGTSLAAGGATFSIGPTGGPNVVQALGQTINLPAGSFQSLELLGTATEGNQGNQKFTVNFANGTSQTFTQNISDWYTPQDFRGESVALAMPYRNASSGGQDHRNFNLYEYTLNFDTAEPAVSITLPDDSHVEVLAMDLASAVAPPTDLVATATAGAVNLSWTSAAGATGYNVFRGTTALGEASTPLNTTPLPANATSFQDPAVLPGDAYYYVLRAIDGSAVSADSNEATATLPANGPTTQVDLGGAFNLQGIKPDGQKFAGGMDGVGNALSANLLGGSVTTGGVPFNISGAGEVVESFGQNVTLPSGTFSQLELLATSVDGNQPNQTFKVNFANGTSQTFTQGVSDWYTPQDYTGESVALTMPYRDRFNGTQDNRNFELYEYTLTFTTPEQVASITLPNNGHVDVLAMTLVAPVAAPTGLTATAAAGAVNLSWTAAGGAITGYNIFRGTLAADLSNTPLNATPLPAGTTSFQDTNVVAGNTYFYVVQAIDGSAVSPNSNPASALLPTASTMTQVDLKGAFDRVGITVDGQKFSGGLDGQGNALSATLLGSSLTSGGVTFNLGTTGTGGVVQSLGQSIGLPAGPFSKLELVATAVDGNQPNQTFVVHYTDGTSSPFTQSLSDWYTPQHYAGESVALTMAYRNQSNGGEDHRDFNLYQYSLTLDPSKTVASITLPNNGHVEVLAITAVD